jgi:NAD(P)H-quinone oxidoreductase subunit 4
MTDSYRTSIEALVSRDLGAMERISQPSAPLIRNQPLAVPAMAGGDQLQAPALPAA